MANNRVARGVRKVNETITQDGRALVLTEEQADKLNWSDIPIGSIRINTAPKSNGTWSVKIEGESDWIPGNVKNDGTVNVVKDSRIVTEVFTIKQLDIPNNKREFVYFRDGIDDADHRRYGTILYKNNVGACGEFGQYGTYPTWKDCKRYLLIDDDTLESKYKNTKLVGYIFQLEQGDYAMMREHLTVTIDDVLHRDAISGGVKEISETRFCLTENELSNGMEVSARYICAFRLGNPYPRWFINSNEPETKAAEIGDFWLDPDGTLSDIDPLGDYIEDDGRLDWWRIRPSTRPTSLSGYGITDKVSYQGHNHTVKEIVGLSNALLNVKHAESADNATNADNATEAKHAAAAAEAAKATSATRAINDGSNRNIESTYATKAELENVRKAAALNVPIGTILPYAGSAANIPSGWYICDGSNGTPDLRGHFLEGATTGIGTKRKAGLPNITGSFGYQDEYVVDVSNRSNPRRWTGALYRGQKAPWRDGRGGGESDDWYEYGFDASKSNAIYGKSSTVQPASYLVYFIMKKK